MNIHKPIAFSPALDRKDALIPYCLPLPALPDLRGGYYVIQIKPPLI